MVIFVKSKNNYFWKKCSTYFLNFLKILPYTLTIKIRPWNVGQGTCITLPYLNSKGKIIEKGVENIPPPAINIRQKEQMATVGYQREIK